MRASLVFTIVEDDGKPFSGNTTTWDNLDKAQANALEAKGIEFLASLNKWGAENAAGKGKPE